MMKKLNLTKLNVVLLIAAVVILASCRNNQANVDRAVGVFFIGVLQVINMMFFGVTCLIMCIVSATNPNQVYKILGWIFLGIFTLFMLVGLNAILQLGPKHGEIFIIFLMELAMMVVSLIFVLKKPSPKSQQTIQKKNIDTVFTEIDDIDEII